MVGRLPKPIFSVFFSFLSQHSPSYSPLPVPELPADEAILRWPRQHHRLRA